MTLNFAHQDLENRFSYHPPATSDTGVKHSLVRENCLSLAEFLNSTLPPGRETSLAVTKLEEVMYWANAAIARNS